MSSAPSSTPARRRNRFVVSAGKTPVASSSTAPAAPIVASNTVPNRIPNRPNNKGPGATPAAPPAVSPPTPIVDADLLDIPTRAPRPDSGVPVAFPDLLHQVCRQFVPAVCKKSSYDYLSERGIHCRLVADKRSVNPHECEAAIRFSFTVACIEAAILECYRLNRQLVILFASRRELAILATIYDELPCQHSPKVYVHRPVITAKDIHRDSEIKAFICTNLGETIYDRGLPEPSPGSIGVMVDVYTYGSFGSTPGGLAQLLANFHIARCYMCQHKFNGVLGETASAYWYREERKITYSPDAMQVYDSHDACDYLWQDGSVDLDLPVQKHHELLRDLTPENGSLALAWTLDSGVGDMGRFTVSFWTPQVVKYSELPSTMALFIKDGHYLDRNIHNKLVNDYLPKMRVGFNLQSLIKETTRQFHETYPIASKNAPNIPDLVRRQALAAWTDRTREVANELDEQASAVASANLVINERLHEVNAPRQLHFWNRAYWTEAHIRGFLFGYFRTTLFWWIQQRYGWFVAFLAMFVLQYSNYFGFLQQPMNLFGTKWSVFVETLLERIPGMPFIIGSIEGIQNHSLMPMAFHYAMSLLPMHFALPVHIIWNWFANAPHENPYLHQFLTSRYTSQDRDVVSKYPSSQMTRLRVTFADKPKKAQADDIHVESTLNIPNTTPSFWYQFVTFDVPVYVYGSCPLLLEFAVHQRLTAQPPMPVQDQIKAWEPLYKLVDELMPWPLFVSIEWTDHVEDWLEKVKDKKKRRKLEHAVLVYKQNGLVYRKRVTMIMIKRDELQPHPSREHCPRTISVVDSVIQAAVGPHLYEGMNRLKALWNSQIIIVRRIAFTLTVGCGMTAGQLDDWAHRALNGPGDIFHIIVAGDDSVVVYKGRAIAADASMFDASQSVGPLEVEYHTLKWLGVPPEAITILREMSRLPYLYVDKRTNDRLFIDRHLHPTRDTGGPDTTIGNTINMMLAWIYVLLKGNVDPGYMAHEFLNLGFKMKMKEWVTSIECVSYVVIGCCLKMAFIGYRASVA